MRPPQNSVGLARVAVVTTATTTATMSMATQAPAGGGAMMAMPSAAMMMPTMPQPTGGGCGGPAGPALQANASLGLFSAADNGLAQDEVAIGIDLGGEWVRASVWDADQKRVVALDLDGFGGPLRAVCRRGLEPSTSRPSRPQAGPATHTREPHLGQVVANDLLRRVEFIGKGIRRKKWLLPVDGQFKIGQVANMRAP